MLALAAGLDTVDPAAAAPQHGDDLQSPAEQEAVVSDIIIDGAPAARRSRDDHSRPRRTRHGPSGPTPGATEH